MTWLNYLNISQIITEATRIDLKSPEKATLFDLILANTPNKYQAAVFCQELRDHCFVSYIRRGLKDKLPPLILSKRSLRNLNEHTFYFTWFSFNWLEQNNTYSDCRRLMGLF